MTPVSPTVFEYFLLNLIQSMIPIGFGFVFLGWKRRYKSNEKRKALLNLPINTIKGSIYSVCPYNFERNKLITYRSIYQYFYEYDALIRHNPNLAAQFIVQEGVTRKSYYYHNNYYDGFIVTILPIDKDYTHRVEIRTLPKGFYKVKEIIPQLPRKVIINYVTDSDGTNYLIPTC